jgi:hypothetical protein
MESLLRSGNSIVRNIRDKLGRLQCSSVEPEALVHQLVSGYAVGKNELEALNERFPGIYRSVILLKASKERQLGVRVLSSQGGHGSILSHVLDDYEDKLSQDFSETLTAALIARLSMEAISDWLGRCPLDFPVLRSG